MINERQMIDGEHEANFATNTLGTYILTTNLIPVLDKNQPARVFITSSGGEKTKILDLISAMSVFCRHVQCLIGS